MPLDKDTLQSDLESLFKKPPVRESDCAKKWASAMQDYATAIVPSASAAVATAASALEGALAGIAAPGAAAAIMELAFTAFATAVGGVCR